MYKYISLWQYQAYGHPSCVHLWCSAIGIPVVTLKRHTLYFPHRKMTITLTPLPLHFFHNNSNSILSSCTKYEGQFVAG